MGKRAFLVCAVAPPALYSSGDFVQTKRGAAMTKEQVENLQEAKEAAEKGAESADTRERSTIQFPYNDLDDAVDLAKVIYTNAGGNCTLDQLAGYLKQPITSGTFRLRVSNASTFGLTENERGTVRLTELGRRIADTAQEHAARVDAFLNVPLYQNIYDNYKGFTLPGPGALEKYMRDVGVSSKQTGKARHAFTRSAKQAGFFAHGEDRLVRPAMSPGPGTKPIDEPKKEADAIKDDNRKGSGGGDPPEIDPIIRGLLARLPKVSEVWPKSQRKLWLQLLEGSFELIYRDVESPKVPKKSEAEIKEELSREGFEDIN
jgi:hypothetical protein